MDYTIEKQWDGNETHSEYGNRIYTSKGRWQWVVIVDGEADEAFDTKRDAASRIDQLTAQAQATSVAAAALGRRGGSAKSAAKTAASRINGRKGGWPKGRARKPRVSAAAQLVRIPRTFFQDHADRSLPTPNVVRSTARHLWIDRNDRAFAELVDDARFYFNDGRGGVDGYPHLVAAAGALLRAVAQEGGAR